MAYTVGASVEDSSGLAALTVFDAPNFTAVAGDTLIACLAYFSTNVVPTISDIVGTNDTWTEVEAGIWDAESASSLRIFYLNNASAGSCTVRASFGSAVDYPGIWVLAVSGLAAAPLDDATFAYQVSPGNATDAVTSGNLNTLAMQPAMIFGYGLCLKDDTPATGTGFTSIASGHFFGGVIEKGRIEHKRVTATTPTKATFTAVDTTFDWLSATVAFKEYVAPTPPPPPLGRRYYVMP